MIPSNQASEIVEIASRLTRKGWSAREVAFNEVSGSPLWIVLSRKHRAKIQRASRSRVEAWRLTLEQVEGVSLAVVSAQQSTADFQRLMTPHLGSS